MNSLVEDMTRDDPSKRPKMTEVVARYEQVQSDITTRTLRRRIVDRDESSATRLFREIKHAFVSAGYMLRRLPPLPTPRSTTTASYSSSASAPAVTLLYISQGTYMLVQALVIPLMSPSRLFSITVNSGLNERSKFMSALLLSYRTSSKYIKLSRKAVSSSSSLSTVHMVISSVSLRKQPYS